MNKSNSSVMLFALIIIGVALDVLTTHIGVLILNNREASPIAQLFIKHFGYLWWIIYLPYEAFVLLAVFLAIRTFRTKFLSKINFQASKIPIEYALTMILFSTIVNNILQIFYG
jgi:hypothetical protein